MLKNIERQIGKCKKCDLWKVRNRPVAGEGPENAELFFVGEAPGRFEDLVGRPFVGQAGKFLDKLFSEFSISRERVFLTGIVKCRPPKNRKPTKREIEACKPYTMKQIEIIKPKLVVLLGSTALEGMLGLKNLKKWHGKMFKKDGQRFFITFHPSAARRFPSVRKLMKKDFEKLKRIISKEKIWS